MIAEDDVDPGDDWYDDDPLDDRALDYWEPDCSCYGHGCPQCGHFARGLRGVGQRIALWARDRRYAISERLQRFRRRKPTYFDEPPY